MKINKQSNLYTIIYVAVIVLIVGAALAITSLSLKDRQQANIDADKMRQMHDKLVGDIEQLMHQSSTFHCTFSSKSVRTS